MQGIKRRIVYVALYEGFGFLAASTGIAAGSGSDYGHASLVAIISSTIAVLWNLIFNVLFEKVESRLNLHGRNLKNRIIHALCFEGGLNLILLPIFATILGIGLWKAFWLNLGVSSFFMVYAFVYNWAFDLIFGLPSSVSPKQPSQA